MDTWCLFDSQMDINCQFGIYHTNTLSIWWSAYASYPFQFSRKPLLLYYSIFMHSQVSSTSLYYIPYKISSVADALRCNEFFKEVLQNLTRMHMVSGSKQEIFLVISKKQKVIFWMVKHVSFSQLQYSSTMPSYICIPIMLIEPFLWFIFHA